MSNRTKEEIAKDIKFVLEDKVAPAVAQHNGFINYLDFDMEFNTCFVPIVYSLAFKASFKVFSSSFCIVTPFKIQFKRLIDLLEF